MNDFEKVKSIFEKQGLFIGVVYDINDLDVRSTEDLDVIMKHWSPKLDILDENDTINLTTQKFDIANQFTELTFEQQKFVVSELMMRGVANDNE